MGYYIDMTDSEFSIKKENFDNALKALKGIFIPENMTCYDYIGGCRIPHFRWVNTNDVLNSNTLEEALVEIRYNPIFNSEGNIIDVEFTGQKYGDESVFFSAIAPYVENGSYLEYRGEDGEMWRYCFEDGQCVKKNAVIVWE